MKPTNETNPAEFNGNGKGKAVALLEKPIDDTIAKSLPIIPAPETEISAPSDVKTGAETELQAPLPTAATPKKKSKKPMIFALLGVGAIAAGGFGYHYWQYASIHQETENATVAGHIYQISSRVNGTVGEVMVKDNQQVKPGQLLIKLDPRDYQVKVQQAQAALENARRQAEAAEANISLASQTSQGKTTQAQGDISGANAAISTAQAALREAQQGVPAAEATVAEAQAGVPAAEAKVTQAQAGIPQAEAKVTEAEAGIAQAQAQLAQAQATLVKTQADYKRYEGLQTEGAIARQQLDSAKAAYDVAVGQTTAAQQGIAQARARLAQATEGVTAAQATVAQAQEGVKQAQAQVARAQVGIASAQAKVAVAQEGITTAQAKLATSKGGLQQAEATGEQTKVSRSQYDAAKAAIAQSQASVKDAQLQLSYANITAPAAGQIGRKSVEVGQRVQSGTPLMAIVSNDLWVVANFKETQLANIKPGQKVEIKLDAFGGRKFEGRVDSFSPASGAQFSLLPPDNATGNFTKVVQRIPVKVVFDAESVKGYESRIAPGMSATVNVELK
ncbi:MAG: efflux RND transporter periplasmic adaptor subunit [Tychonema bourrellyi B0820]|uniref:Secretion protein HlyD n=1 Tax=Tychonema bourrellyi FEM_GT703 TaxID=2040638 RepID=A0A2G4F155_9CYAN|nr:HlyD family secretion protein [Tychonema bourrellyi]MDQ2097579.1 efflux RND transporter periplasmic adaptor subunit [Tychonema bourrellyi B0820]PHX55489.1 secretion protein HlyD [Tychonema bourrellyi FEM_GT703]